jgi:Lrp/AsnC family transcriptional regulator, leucine-responsive regulatory protein
LESKTVDALDHRILQRLANDARRPYSEVARELGVSQPTVAERVRRMEERGIIQGAMLRIDHAKLGYPIGAFIRIVATPQVQYKLEKIAQAIPQVVEMHRVTGEDTLIVRAVLRSVAELSEVIGRLSQYGGSNTSIVLGTPIELRTPLLAAD